MYAAYWNLKLKPFLNVMDRRFLFSSSQHEEAIARLQFIAENNRLAGVLTGIYGIGKSTVLKIVASNLETQHRLPVICMDAIPDGYLPMMRTILDAMKVDSAATTLPDALMDLWRTANARPDSLTRTILCIDEAHYLATEEGFYFVHYLTNLRRTDRRTQAEEPLFSVILSGAPQLAPAIQSAPSLSQRVQISYEITPLTAAQTTAYVQHHMRLAGGDIWSFGGPALDAIHRISGGIPRKINLLCDTALMLGYAAQVNQVTPAIIQQAAGDAGLKPAPPPPIQQENVR